jgi:hypothetical protein
VSFFFLADIQNNPSLMHHNQLVSVIQGCLHVVGNHYALLAKLDILPLVMVIRLQYF